LSETTTASPARAAIDREVMADLILAISEDHSGDVEEAGKIARAIVIALASDKVRHATIDYTAIRTKEGALL
jgi:hypothetical protein